jgi:hypothetical protein
MPTSHAPQRARPEDDGSQRENDDNLPYRKKAKHCFSLRLLNFAASNDDPRFRED